ncbi:MAG: 5-oxoprolinase, partial [Deltaproteobacteria bacterium]
MAPIDRAETGGASAPSGGPAQGWDFWVDRGGTFTDCIGIAPDGTLHTAKVLSSDTAPVEAIRAVLGAAGVLEPDAPPPRCRVRLGTTVATNALLERRGVRTLLVANRGLGDVVAIGTQERPELFTLAVEKPPPVQERVVEVAGRVGVDGVAIEPLDEPAAREALAAARRDGIESVAIALIHAYATPDFERRLCELAREVGFAHVIASHEIAREMGLLARAETTAVDAYLTPLLRRHVSALEAALPGSALRFMQSSGGVTDALRFRGPNALLSGPAGGVVGAARVAASAGFERAIGFDMGGTSTDVSLIRGGECERSFETTVGGVRVKAPMLKIHTIAAGGGSLCRFDGFRLTVGPESAGAEPGPLCYGRSGGADGAAEDGLALTDVNLFLGRLQPDRFSFAVERAPVEAALRALRARLRRAGHALDLDDVAAGFVEIANASMAQAIAKVSVERGVDPRDHALVGFGGAAGQHVCAVARALGIRSVLLHPLAGILSAYGIGLSETTWDGQRDAGRVILPEGRAALPDAIQGALSALEGDGRAALVAEGIGRDAVRAERWLDLRYRGSETPLPIREPADLDFARAFVAEHRARFGYTRPGRAIEIMTARVRARGPGRAPPAAPPLRRVGSAASRARSARVWFPGVGRVSAPIRDRESLRVGEVVRGPVVLLEDTGTVVIDPGFVARVASDGRLAIEDAEGPQHAHDADLERFDPIRLEVFGNRFMSIA